MNKLNYCINKIKLDLQTELIIFLGGITGENVISGDCWDVKKALKLIYSLMKSVMLGHDLLVFSYGTDIGSLNLLYEKKLERIEQVKYKCFNEIYNNSCNNFYSI